MKDYCLEIAAKQSQPSAKYNVMREYTQAYILKIMQEGGTFLSCAFLGGTALRFLYDLPRFSEDLDFSLVTPGKFMFLELMTRIRRELSLAGYTVGVVVSDDRAVHSAFVKFEGLLFEAGLSRLKSEKFSIKIEVDTRPPEGAVVMTRVVNKFFPMSFLTYDLPSLFAGKAHAILSRKYVKGRDYYDLAWYLSRQKGLCPNIQLLAAALRQTGWDGQPVNGDNWRAVLAGQVGKADWKIVERDAVNFLERPDDMKVFTKDNVVALIKG